MTQDLDRRSITPRFVLAMLLALAPGVAFAHPGGLHVHGFAEGLEHPLFGWDHLAAMVAVGVVATQLRGRALLAVPGSFVLAMLAGAMLAMAGATLPMVEIGIALSLMVLGALVATRTTLPLLGTSALVAGFGFVHGFAHGMEAPANASGLAYLAGFALATPLLHATGILAGTTAGGASASTGRMALRLAGAVTATLGAALAVNVI
jgi:urease accessory protein